MGPGGSGLSPGTTVLNAEAGAAPSPFGSITAVPSAAPRAFAGEQLPCRASQDPAPQVSRGWSLSPLTLHGSVCRKQIFPAPAFS